MASRRIRTRQAARESATLDENPHWKPPPQDPAPVSSDRLILQSPIRKQASVIELCYLCRKQCYNFIMLSTALLWEPAYQCGASQLVYRVAAQHRKAANAQI